MNPATPSQPAHARPRVSVVMANFNGGKYLLDAIQSVQEQTEGDLEIIVSDDASADDSAEIVASLQASDPRIRLLRGDRNRGPAAARNRAIDVATGDWIAIVDSDDLMHPERLATLLAAATRDGADLVADNALEFFADRSRPTRLVLQAREPFWVNITDFVRLNPLYGSGPALGLLKPLIRASVLKNGPTRYDETLRIAEDYDLILHLLYRGNSMRIYPTAMYYYRKHANSISHRWTANALTAIKASAERFRAEVSPHERLLVEATDARIKAVDIALAYEELLAALKARDWRRAFLTSVKKPRAALLLRLPLIVRVRRFLPLRTTESLVRRLGFAASEPQLQPDYERRLHR
jgi:GT2 family glycosyltransferase